MDADLGILTLQFVNKKCKRVVLFRWRGNKGKKKMKTIELGRGQDLQHYNNLPIVDGANYGRKNLADAKGSQGQATPQE